MYSKVPTRIQFVCTGMHFHGLLCQSRLLSNAYKAHLLGGGGGLAWELVLNPMHTRQISLNSEMYFQVSCIAVCYTGQELDTCFSTAVPGFSRDFSSCFAAWAGNSKEKSWCTWKGPQNGRLTCAKVSGSEMIKVIWLEFLITFALDGVFLLH